MEKAYTLRTLNANDLFLMMKIINKIGIKEVKGLFASAEMKRIISEAMQDGEVNDAVASNVGMQLMLEIVCLVVEHIPDCQDEIYKFLSSLSGMKVEDIANLDMNDFMDMVMEVLKKQEFKDFFQRLVGSLK